ncbi:MAG: hypothetical protein LBO05_10975 [Deltaproteobacteria bacterium]|jgi:hypothetical protein|nr:hypothetical protein [Deltaproteobacteria bacterium]
MTKNSQDKFLNKTLEDFRRLMLTTTVSLIEKAGSDEPFLTNKDGTSLKEVVFHEIRRLSRDAGFGYPVELAREGKFPGIVVGGKFGVEIESPPTSNWQSTASSVPESNRVDGLANICVIYGKLTSPVEFFFKLYDDNGNLLGPDDDIKAPKTIGLLNHLLTPFRTNICLKGLILFPEIYSNKLTKYNNLETHLQNNYNLGCHNLRDLFTAGGKISYRSKDGSFIIENGVPRKFNLLIDNKDLFIALFKDLYSKRLIDYNIKEWVERVVLFEDSFKYTRQLLEDLFSDYLTDPSSSFSTSTVQR